MTDLLAWLLVTAATTALMCLPITLYALCRLYDRWHPKPRVVVSGTPLTDRGYNSNRRFDHDLADIRGLPERGQS